MGTWEDMVPGAARTITTSREKTGRDCENGVNRERRAEEKRKVGDSI